MSPITRRCVRFCLAALAVLAMTPVLVSRADERAALEAAGRNCGAIHEEIAARGIPVASVRFADGKYELMFGPECSAGQKAEAEQIMARVLAARPVTLVVDNLQDALVVLQFDPQNASARKLVKERYDALVAAARDR